MLRVAHQGEATYVIVAGGTPRGTKAALAVLMKTIQVEDKSAFLPGSARSGRQAGVRQAGHAL